MENRKSELNNLLYMKVAEAYELSKSSALADKIWQFKNPNESIDHKNQEYISWINSLHIFLEGVHDACLDDLYVVFEMKTPISNKAIDVILLGNITDYLKNKKGVNSKKGVLIVELKQWCEIFPCKYERKGKVYIDTNKVCISEKDKRRHPLRQLSIYENNLKNHHSGIQKANEPCIDIIFGKLAYLHNFYEKEKLYTGEYEKYESYKKHIYGGGDEEKKRLVKNLKLCFINDSDDELLEILNDYEAIMGDDGLAGLKKAYKNQATYTMMQDQQEITDFVSEHLKRQKQNPHKEIIVISGGPGTGKTIAGIRFILEYVSIFNNGRNDNKVIFCLPKSKTVKAMFDAACSVDDENENEYCCYLDDIGYNQNLVVVDEAHRILDLEKKLNKVFNKGTKLLVLLQDDHQLVRPGEQGTFSRFKDYASRNNIEFSPSDENQKKTLTLIDEKRCDPALYDGLIKLLYDDKHPLTKPIDCVHVFNNLSDLMSWRDNLAKESRTKYVFPFAWPWTSRKDSDKKDDNKKDDNKKDVFIKGEGFSRYWNPADTDDQVVWLNDNKDDRVACIYTSQGLDMDNVALVWWDDLSWDPSTNNWVIDHQKLEDSPFKKLQKNPNADQWVLKEKKGKEEKIVAVVSRDELDMLIKNTYYVLLSRPRKQLGIWFHDKTTKEHVLEVWGIASE